MSISVQLNLLTLFTSKLSSHFRVATLSSSGKAPFIRAAFKVGGGVPGWAPQILHEAEIEAKDFIEAFASLKLQKVSLYF
jgi:hypothetical protein